MIVPSQAEPVTENKEVDALTPEKFCSVVEPVINISPVNFEFPVTSKIVLSLVVAEAPTITTSPVSTGYIDRLSEDAAQGETPLPPPAPTKSTLQVGNPVIP